jgi:glycosyltransferase involved in cell wall biosynthesis
MTRKRMAIVSSYNEACGNASYTHVLKNSFAKHVDCDVIGLDLFLLQKIEKNFVKAGDRHIREIAERLKTYDYVNIQFEAGLYGASQNDVLRRIKVLMDACKNLTFTMHRVDPPKNDIDTILSKCWDIFWTRGPVGVYSHIINSVGARRHEQLYSRIVRDVRARKIGGQNIWIAVHTKRERRLIEEFFDCKNVFDFPITFLRPEEREELRALTDKTAFHKKHSVPADAKIIGAFGFVSAYKGYETLIKALAMLPDNYHLYIFGGQHPQSIQPNMPIDEYLQRLIDLIDTETTQLFDKSSRSVTLASLLSKPDTSSPQKRKAPAAKTATDIADTSGKGLNLSAAMRKELINRVRFVGGLDDPDFLEALRLSDAVVLPYLEVGQSMSGVVCLALEALANMFCTNNNSMNEVRRYHGDVYTTFDIGNYVELAQKLQTPRPDYGPQRDKSYAKYNIIENVHRHLEVLGHSPIAAE